MRALILLAIMSLFLAGCATNSKNTVNGAPAATSPRVMSELAEGKRLFEKGYYKKSMQQLLPIAVGGNAEAQYAVGYMYYYGYGVSRDVDSGKFWIDRSAAQNFKPALQAQAMINKKK